MSERTRALHESQDVPVPAGADRPPPSMWEPGRTAPALVHSALRSPGRRLPDELRPDTPSPHDFSRVRVHTDRTAADAAMALDAQAFTVGTDIVFGPGQFAPGTASGRALIRHELVHVAQGGSRRPGSSAVMTASPESERVASLSPTEQPALRTDGHGPQNGAGVVQRHPAEKVLRFTVKWLTKRTAKQITKHISRHTRRIARRGVHSVFRNPRALRYTVKRTVDEALDVVSRHATHAVTQAVEEGSVRIMRQTTRTPGKFRWLIEKTFTEAIGTAGERVLRIVVDQSGRIVTAFPADRLAIVGLTAAGLGAFTARTADAAETVSHSIERQTALEEAASAPPETSWWEWVPIIGDLWGGELNSGESELLAARDENQRRDKYVDDVVAATVADIEADLQSTLGPEKRADVEEYVRMVISSGIDVSHEE